MKILTKVITTLAFVFAGIVLNSCGNEPEVSVPGRIENDGATRVSVLHLGSRDITNLADIDNVEFVLEDPKNRVNFKFNGNLFLDKSLKGLDSPAAIVCRIGIGEVNIPDGEYYLAIHGDNIPDIHLRKVSFKGNIGNEIRTESMSYDDLKGLGTKDDPYLINDDGDFLTLIWYLMDDEEHAYGKYFLQTSSFDVPRSSQMIDGHVWHPVTFSGTYDGGGYELRNLTYQGSSDKHSDSGIGLFKTLYSATVRNLSLTNAMIVNVVDYVGILAGNCEGNTLLENISLSGTLSSSGNMGGALVGNSTGSLTVRNVRMNSLMVNGNESSSSWMGLLIGRHSGESLTVDKVSTPNHIFQINGKDKIGGITGEVNVSDCISISNVTLEHSVDVESSSTKVIYGSGSYVGGLIGFTDQSEDIEITGITIKAPVRGNGDVGALAGHAYVSRMNVSTVTLASVVNGQGSVGGFFGYLGFRNQGSTMSFDSGKGAIRYVVKSSADAGVTGDRYVGGLVGYFDSDKGKMEFNGSVEVAVNVKGREMVGGAIGYGNKLDEFNTGGINFSSPTMRVEASDNYAGGVIGYVKSGSIKGNVEVNPVKSIPARESIPKGFGGVVNSAGTVGGVAGYFIGQIHGVSSAATVTSTGLDAGGIVGRFRGTIGSCAFIGTVSAKVTGAGVVSVASDGEFQISDCINYGDITSSANAGGVIGYGSSYSTNAMEVTRCYNSGHITGGCAGGVAAYVTSDCSLPHFTECGNVGRVEGTGGSDNAVGGVIATFDFRQAYLTSCANHGEVTGADQYAVGGVVGDFGTRSGPNFGKVSQCMNSGRVSASVSSTHVGGVVGHMHSSDLSYNNEIMDCYNTGELPSDQKNDTGGILGYAANYSNTYRTFNRGKVSHGNAIIGTHHSGSLFHHKYNYYLAGTGGSWPSSTEVKSDKIADKSVYHDFDFTNVWDITPDGPVLRNCPFR